MFDSIDIKDLTTLIKEKEEELKKPIDSSPFIPLIKNMVIFHFCFYNDKIEIQDLKYEINVYLDLDYLEKQENFNMTFKITRLQFETVYKKQKNIDKLLKHKLIIDKIINNSSIIICGKAKYNSIERFDNIDNLKITDVEITTINVEEFSILYAINDCIKTKVKEYFEKRLYDLEQQVALRQLSSLPMNINFES